MGPALLIFLGFRYSPEGIRLSIMRDPYLLDVFWKVLYLWGRLIGRVCCLGRFGERPRQSRIALSRSIPPERFPLFFGNKRSKIARVRYHKGYLFFLPTLVLLIFEPSRSRCCSQKAELAWKKVVVLGGGSFRQWRRVLSTGAEGGREKKKKEQMRDIDGPGQAREVNYWIKT